MMVKPVIENEHFGIEDRDGVKPGLDAVTAHEYRNPRSVRGEEHRLVPGDLGATPDVLSIRYHENLAASGPMARPAISPGAQDDSMTAPLQRCRNPRSSRCLTRSAHDQISHAHHAQGQCGFSEPTRLVERAM